MDKKDMKEWLIAFLNSRDVFKRNIEKINEGQNSVEVKYKQKEEEILIVDELNLDLLKKIEENLEKATTFLCKNNKKNLNIMIENWESLVKYKNVKLGWKNSMAQELLYFLKIFLVELGETWRARQHSCHP